MKDENVAAIWASIVLILGILTMGSCTMYQSYLVADMVNHGTDPVRAACIYQTVGNRNMGCQ